MTMAQQDRDPDGAPSDPGNVIKLVIAWAWVGIPLCWGVWQVFKRSLALFQ